MRFAFKQFFVWLNRSKWSFFLFKIWSGWGSKCCYYPGILHWCVMALHCVQCPDGDKNCHLWTAVDLAFFIMMGLVGGLLGALFNCVNKCLAKYRIKHIHPKAKFIRWLLIPINQSLLLLLRLSLTESDDQSVIYMHIYVCISIYVCGCIYIYMFV